MASKVRKAQMSDEKKALLDKILPFLPIVLPIIRGVVNKTENKVDEHALNLMIAILEEITKVDIDPSI